MTCHLGEQAEGEAQGEAELEGGFQTVSAGAGGGTRALLRSRQRRGRVHRTRTPAVALTRWRGSHDRAWV